MVIAALVAAALASQQPAVSGAAVRFARNAHKVDGFHAVGPETPVGERVRRLVATNGSGYLPNDIIVRAPDAALLEGRIPREYEESPCEVGVVTARAFVPADITGEYESVSGVSYRDVRNPPIPGNTREGCWFSAIKARRVGVGTYDVDFDDFPHPPSTACPALQYEILVTVKSERSAPFTATTWTKCDERGEVVEQVRIFDTVGVLQDASFTIALLTDLLPILAP